LLEMKNGMSKPFSVFGSNGIKNQPFEY